MPITNNEIHFKHGLKDDFDLATKNADTLYFITDTQELYLGSQKYCGNIGVGSTLPQQQYQGKMFILNQNNNYSLYISDGTTWSSTTALTEQQFELYRQEIADSATALAQTYSDSMTALYAEYQTKINKGLSDIDTAVAAAQLVTGPFYVIDNQVNKTYQAAFQIASDGTPQLKYEEFVEQQGGGE